MKGSDAMELRPITCCFTGHRINKLPWVANEKDPRCVELKEKLFAVTEAVYLSGCTRFICGMANGCDMYFCETVIKLREAHPEIYLEAAVPFPGQPDRWSEPLRKRYRQLLDKCDKVSVLQHTHTPDCMMRRNKYMVDNSGVLIACYDGTPGGTQNTILYAMREKIEIVQLPLE